MNTESAVAIDGTIRIAPEARRAFDREWRQTCACPQLDILERDGRLRCGGCNAPILRRHRVEVQP
ncbi:MAG TPA: hypothetical protein VGL81_14515 [Polyangiaceae bacterium]|jgi:hypothetical protein